MKRSTAILFSMLITMFTLCQPAKAAGIFFDPFNALTGWTVTFDSGTAGTDSADASPAPSGNPYGFLVEGAPSILIETTKITRSLSTLGYNNVHLQFYYKTVSANEQSTDFTQFHYRKTGDSLWTTFDIKNVNWTMESLSLSGIDNSSVDISFSVHNTLGDDSADFLYLDDINLTGDSLNGIPEPATMFLFTSGLAGLAMRKRKK